MSLLERLNDDMKQAMKNKEKEKLSVIRMLKAALQNEAIKLGKQQLSEEEELTVLSREVKQRKDSLHEFNKADRTDLVEKVQSELAFVEKYMPPQLSEEEVEVLVQEAISESGATSKADMGKVMGILMPKVKGKADGTLVSKLVQRHLSARSRVCAPAPPADLDFLEGFEPERICLKPPCQSASLPAKRAQACVRCATTTTRACLHRAGRTTGIAPFPPPPSRRSGRSSA